MKHLFLDFDGVLNSDEFFCRHRGRSDELDPIAVERLDRLLRLEPMNVVISSTWRIGPTLPRLRQLLRNAGLSRDVKIVGKTPVHDNDIRGSEIQSWMADHAVRIRDIVILDDDDDMGHLRHRLVRTDWKVGLQDEHIDQVIALFSSETK